MSYFKSPNASFDGINTKQSTNIYFQSRRSPVLSHYGMVASSQPLVSQIGQSILKQNGNAVDGTIMHYSYRTIITHTKTTIH